MSADLKPQRAPAGKGKRTDAQRERDNAARKARRDQQRRDGTYKRPPDRPRLWIDGRHVYLGQDAVDPDDFGHPESDVRMPA